MNQRIAVLHHMQTRGSITPLEALREYGVFRLAARVWELRGEGWDIQSDEVTLPNGKSIASYSLPRKPEQIGAGL